jgi:hypothetical protein
LLHGAEQIVSRQVDTGVQIVKLSDLTVEVIAVPVQVLSRPVELEFRPLMGDFGLGS